MWCVLWWCVRLSDVHRNGRSFVTRRIRLGTARSLSKTHRSLALSRRTQPLCLRLRLLCLCLCLFCLLCRFGRRCTGRCALSRGGLYGCGLGALPCAHHILCRLFPLPPLCGGCQQHTHSPQSGGSHAPHSPTAHFARRLCLCLCLCRFECECGGGRVGAFRAGAASEYVRCMLLCMWCAANHLLLVFVFVIGCGLGVSADQIVILPPHQKRGHAQRLLDVCLCLCLLPFSRLIESASHTAPTYMSCVVWWWCGGV